MALWENTLMFYKYYCVDNNDFLNKIFDKTIFELIKNGQGEIRLALFNA